jgi:hypothetical protein
MKTRASPAPRAVTEKGPTRAPRDGTVSGARAGMSPSPPRLTRVKRATPRQERRMLARRIPSTRYESVIWGSAADPVTTRVKITRGNMARVRVAAAR